ncbi:PREDICTED: nuclear valosin-containing protein-like isoform X2 [Nicrophorus vespilloides]|uniref:Nuclear valosin-containing protein-like isoform X2 n=1 Tax=Nicrophorus vespilloides TaxID=110193 RepID=A0ABM1MGU3_NICVS|nr:PREDICTED: nuclear valosin-containing protein-like isoform X2 [Nicrophorus vespilloides]
MCEVRRRCNTACFIVARKEGTEYYRDCIQQLGGGSRRNMRRINKYQEIEVLPVNTSSKGAKMVRNMYFSDASIIPRVQKADNSMNNQIMEMYSRNNAPKPLDENELIDISSDDSQDNEDSHKSNGPSTSTTSQVQPHFLDKFLPKIAPNEVNVFKVADDDQPDPVTNTNDRGKKRKPDVNMTSTPKKKRSSVTPNLEEPKVSFKDLGGMDKTLTDVCKLLVHIKHPEVYRQIGISPPRGFLLHGPPGCGKTLLANAIAGELEIPLLKVAAPELVAGVSGESEERIRELFERAAVSAPCVLFIDEVDAITPNRQFAQKDMERRIVAQLLTCLDDLNKNESGDQVLVIGATNRPDSLDPALRRSGRFDREVCLGIPDSDARLHILKVLTSKLKLEDNFDFSSLAKFTPGFVGADLMALTREAALAAVSRVFNDLREKQKLEQAMALQSSVDCQENGSNDTESKSDAEIVVDDENKSDLADVAVVVSDDDSKTVDKVVAQQSNIINSTHLEMKNMTHLEELLNWLHNASPLTTDQLDNLYVNSEDFAKALKCVQPSAKREGFATVPDVTWEDIGSLKNIREELQLAILAPVRHRDQFKSLGLNTPTGVLLCGPPGCGKTLLAKAIANEAGINFISVKGPELLNMYVGESERAVRLCFERARNSSPCVIFFDELDALCPKRSDSREGGATMRVVNQMLTEMDGVEGREGVYLLAASNRPDIVDPAVLRPGRLDKILYVGLPSPDERVDILRTITKNGTRPVLAHDVDLEQIGKCDRCEGYTGADLAALVREAGVQALREVMMQGDMQKAILVTTEHFTKAIAKIRPSVSDEDQLKYERLKKIYTAKPDVEEMEYS